MEVGLAKGLGATKVDYRFETGRLEEADCLLSIDAFDDLMANSRDDMGPQAS